MPRYEYDPSKAAATIEVFPKDDYEFQIGEPKSFIRKNKKGEDSFGVRFPIVIMEGKFANKRTFYTCYLHSDGGQGFAKQFQMAALGFTVNAEGEAQFDKSQTGRDWSFDPNTGAVGDAWRDLTGARVIGSLDVGKNEETDEPQQQFKKWRPISA